MNGEPIRLDDYDYYTLIQLRIDLMHSVPITSPEITEVECKLVNHPMTKLRTHFSILSRALLVEALLYGFADPDTRHRTLLSLRETFDAVQRWPEPWQEAIAPLFAQWTEVLNAEERRNGTA
jgi:hypothetical protein